MSNELFDFGFTLVDENELEAVQKAQETVSSVSATTSETQEKLDSLFNAIQPLLNNLKQNPEKEYILCSFDKIRPQCLDEIFKTSLLLQLISV